MRSASHLELVRGSITTAATLAHERTLPVAEGLTELLPNGSMQRGSTLAVHGSGATSFGLALVGQAVRDGSFLAVVAPPSFNLAPCIDYKIPLRRVVQFVLPTDGAKWAQAVAAIVEGFDVVMLADRNRVGSSQARLLTARNRERGSVLVRVGGASWAEAADLRFDVNVSEWSGLGQGSGHLVARRVAVRVAGRRYHGDSKAHKLLLPAPGGGVEPATVRPLMAQPVTQSSVTQSSVTQSSVTQPEVERERYAGADIDDLLDIIDGVGAARGAEQVDRTDGTEQLEEPEGLGTDAGAGGGHLDAIA